MKPIAWMSPDGKVSKTEGKLFYIPLYTTPRELSDEEIGLMTTDPRWEHIESPLLWEFARAILKKANEFTRSEK